MLSASTRNIDLKDRVEIYREAGAAEYWIFDLDEGSVRIYRFGENRHAPVAVKSFGAIVSTSLLPGFSLNLPSIRRVIGLESKASLLPPPPPDRLDRRSGRHAKKVPLLVLRDNWLAEE
ncbi:MAG: Uma2 family endonuclease [Methylacidiphilaceae bacterium]|nr:Uma2 family endonuclease [Candidatus Methylacidiphilaceae bacterium]